MSSRAASKPLRSVLAENVRRARDERGWSQEFLAERAGLTQVYISQIETSKTAASVDTIEKLAAGFDVNAGDLLICT
ncbi:helix-turn-helix transcriptional regulator [uncultured Nevskia sp.]|uniref:helix-turn-helix domain-containing protein n=1 Tax=uncultured Nevskia sp. TaxID=228950 RepID=UPI0025CBFB5B|nr:helix-turn-helix transcriptional regulator [uncultured Nevskia sp.]